MGDQAALSGLSGVPQGRLFGADVAVTVCKGTFDGEVYGSSRRMENLARVRSNIMYTAARFLLTR